ncbi:MAG TPA: signal peptidase I [Polyangiaceae bacterium]|jgi:signal peptidase I
MWRKALRALFWIAVVCGVIAGIVSLFFTTWTVPSDDPQLAVSIEPAMSAGDLVLVTRSTGASDGALVRCADPDVPGRFVVARVIGHTGDNLVFSGGTMLVNDSSPSAPSACDPATVHLRNPATQEDVELSCLLEEFAGSTHPVLRNGKTDRDVKTTVEPGKVYLVSDDRALHLDSRDFGPIAPSTCQRIVFRFWSLGGWSDAKKRLTVLW